MAGHLGRGPDKWEIAMQGDSLVKRTSNIARDVQYYRDTINLKINEETQSQHNKYIHQTGAEMLKIQTSEVQKTPQELALEKKLRGKPKLQRRDIKVAEMDDGGHSITIDLEWDTSTWGDTELQAGVDALIGVFESQSTQEKRDQAVRMLIKLLDRHEVAIKYMRGNVQPVMNRAISKRLIGGSTVAALNLLYVLHCSRKHYYFEMSSANYIGLFFEMLLVEAKLAATLIQHTFRTFREMKYARVRPLGELARGWGTQLEAARARQQSINQRSGELRTKWKLMHMHQRKADKTILYGIKGPIHILPKFVVLGLETVEYLVCKKSKDLVHHNREDLIYSQGIILLCTFMTATRSSMSQLSLRILHHVSLSPHSLSGMLKTGVVFGCLKFIQYHRRSGEHFRKNNMIEALEVIGRLANHAAGLTRASYGYGYNVLQSYCDDTHPAVLDYKSVLHADYPGGVLDDYIKYLGTYKVVCELSNIVQTSTDIPIIKAALMNLYLLSGSVCFTVVLEVILQTAGQLLLKLVYFMESVQSDEQVLADLALAILIQQATHEPSREGFMATGIISMLSPLVKEEFFYPRMSYKRAVFVMVSLCRIGEWRSYIPELLLKDISDPTSLTVLIYMDIMKTIKQPHPDSSMSFGQLMMFDSNSQMCEELSEIALRVGVREISDFFVCPMNTKHNSKLSWEMAASGCAIISALVTKLKCAEKVLSTPSVRYMGSCLFHGYSEVCNKALTPEEADLCLAGCDSATAGLAALCKAGKLNTLKAVSVVEGVQESHAAQAANYFLNTFANLANNLLPERTKMLQDRAALTSVKFLERYVGCLLTARTDSADSEVAAVAGTVGKATCKVLGQLIKEFGRSPRTTRILDDICQLIVMLTRPPAGVVLALRSWGVANSLVLHMPEPMNNVGDVLSEDAIYRNGLRQLPRSYFDVISSLCKSDQGKAISLSDGFLRRALDRVALTVPLLEGDEELAHRIRLVKDGHLDEMNDPNRLDIASCLHLIAMSANYNSPTSGSANQLILHPNYRIVELCARLLNSQTCPRDDVAFLGALKVLRYISKDPGSTYELIRDFNIVSIFAREIQNVASIPLDGIVDIVDFTYNVAMGMKGKHIRTELPRMKDPLTKIARVHFRLGQAVSDVLWAISRNHEGADADLAKEGPIYSEEIEELLRLSAEQDLRDNKISMKPGTYEACGVSTCGSLRIPGTCTHGEFSGSNPNAESKKLELCKLARTGDKCEISKESARDPALRKEIQRRKELAHMAEDERQSRVRSLPPVEDSRHRQQGSPSSHRSRSSSFQRTTFTHKTDMTLDDTMPLWIDPSPKKKPAKKRPQRAPIPSIDVSELPELMSTRPPPRPI